MPWSFSPAQGLRKLVRGAARQGVWLVPLVLCAGAITLAQEPKSSNKPPLHATHWVAITGKPLAASAGAVIFTQGGNAVDAACAMLGAVATMWDTLGWGGETQALIRDPRSGKVIAINALGAAPSGATPEYFRDKLHMAYPPEYGPLAATTPGTPGGLLVMLARYGTMSLAQVLAPAMEMARGYPIEKVQVDNLKGAEGLIRTWPDSSRVFLPHLDPKAPRQSGVPRPGELLRQSDLLATLEKLVQSEREALAKGASREDAIMAAYERFYRGDIAQELTRAVQAAGGLITMADLDRWQVHVEEPVSTTYKGIEVYKLNSWVQGPVMLQMLNLLEGFDLRAMGYNSPQYIHTLYQAMNLAYADRDFYYGDPYYPPEEPIQGLLSKDYARSRAASINPGHNDPTVRPGDPYPFQGGSNPFQELLDKWQIKRAAPPLALADPYGFDHEQALRAGTTSIQAADAAGWMVSITPSGGWIPAFIAGNTGVGLSQRMQSFDMDPSRNPFNVMEPGKRPRATLSPGLALKDGKPLLSFAVQGGDFQDQNLLQFFLNVVEFGMDPQQASEAANMGSYQVHSSFGDHTSEPGKLLLRADTPVEVEVQLARMGYDIVVADKTSGPINGIGFDPVQGTMIGGSSDFGDDYGVAW
ncbi:MAG: gamma-glutamyltransferase [Pseudomonadales bacterium]|jgi:gamma-glutamyltranspeptidase/glutathione hydrolase|nr:gamma-glutamyltransferase [Pseudomonadales bacterium]